jgi:hypothetical protein
MAPRKDLTMKTSGKVVCALFFGGCVVGLLVLLGGGDLWKETPPKEPDTDTRQGDQDKPPDRAEKPPETPGKKASAREMAKAISLAEAVTIAEKIGKGQATKAERKDKPEVNFKIEVVSVDGYKNRVELTADGKVLEKKPEEKKTEEKKPAGKK